MEFRNPEEMYDTVKMIIMHITNASHARYTGRHVLTVVLKRESKATSSSSSLQHSVSSCRVMPA